MQNIDPKILGKIKKCLALASSDNPNEAATALRQAHAMMATHGVTAAQITMADIGESEARSRTMARSKPAQWEMALASVVGKAFGCHLMLKRLPTYKGVRANLNDGAYVFVGIKAQAQIASYTFDVLVRKCKKARSDWIKEKLVGISQMRGGKRTATALGDEFALGWVGKISRLVQDFAQPEAVEQAIADFIQSQTSGKEAPVRKASTEHEKAREVARMQGMRAAAGESIHRPMSGTAAPLQICG